MGQNLSGCAGIGRTTEGTKKPPPLTRRLSVTGSLVDTKGGRDLTISSYSDDRLSAEEREAQGSFRCGVRTRKGMVPDNPGKVNQDRFIVKWGVSNLSNAVVHVFGAFDGHGPYGQDVSDFVARELPAFLSNEVGLVAAPRHAIKAAVLKLTQKLKSKLRKTCTFSGTTAVFGVLIGDKLFTANIGDSRCILATQNGSRGSLKVCALSRDHKPDEPDEKTRILRAGGRVHPFKGYYGEDAGPHRVWLATRDLPGLAMSRSIGDDLAHSVGVSAVPEIKERTLYSPDRFLVYATDGVWDFLSNSQVAKICQKHAPDMDAAAKAIVELSAKLWQKNEAIVDDITCVAVQLAIPEKKTEEAKR